MAIWIGLAMLLVSGAAIPAAEIHEAAKGGDVAAVQRLLDADPALRDAPNDRGIAPIHLAADKGQLEVVKLLLARGTDVNLRETGYNRTPLHLAAGSGRLEVCELLLSKGADLSAREKDNETPIYYATAGGSIETIRLLMSKGADIDDRQSSAGNTPLSLAITRGRAEAALFLIGQGAQLGAGKSEHGSLLTDAIWSGNPRLIEWLVDHGVSVNAATGNGLMPIQVAALWGTPAIVQLLIDKGADPNAHAGGKQETALIQAVNRGNADNAAVLLKAGAKVNLQETSMGWTALHYAAIRGYGTLASLLLEAGAEVNATDQTGRTPLDYAWAHGNATSAKNLAARGGRATGTPAPVDTAALLRRPLAPGESTVWYLAHSGWAVKTQSHLLIFDYMDREKLPDEPGLANGFIHPAEIKDLDVVVFCSHSHGDHYAAKVFEWRKEIPRITYVMGFKPDKQEGYTCLEPWQQQAVAGMKIATIASTDSGVAFWVEVDGVRFLHSGDHANRQDELEKPFTDGIDFLTARGLKADVLFAPVSGCNFQNKKGLTKGVYYSIAQLQPKVVFPMHGNENEASYAYFAGEARAAGVQTQWICAGNCGDAWRLTATDCAPAVP